MVNVEIINLNLWSRNWILGFGSFHIHSCDLDIICVMMIVGCTSQDGRPAKSARRSDREDEDMTHAYLW
jgi:hypothetical protein